MNIVYIHPYCCSQSVPTESRPYYLSKGFIKNNASVSIISSSYHHLQKQVIDQKELVFEKKVEGVNFRWLKVPKYNGSGLKRVINMFVFGARILFLDPVKHFNLNSPDLIIASSVHPFHLIGAIRWAKKYRAKIFFEVRDPWPLSLNQILGLSKYHPFSLLLSCFQYIGHRFTDKTISLAPYLKKYMVQHGLKEEKFVYVGNGIDLTMEMTDESDLDKQLSKIREKYSTVLIYAGAHGKPNSLDTIIDAFNLIESDNIALIMLGNGDEKNKLVKKSTNANCFFFDYVPKSQIQKILSFCDICLIAWSDIDLYQYGVSPNKIFDYMLAKKPIIQAINSPGNHVELSGCGINVKPENPEEFRIAIEIFDAMKKDERDQYGEKGYQFLLKNFDYIKLSEKILKAYAECL